MQDILHQRKRMLAYYAFLFAAVWGAFSVSRPESFAGNSALSLLMATIGVLFCLTDSLVRGRPIPLLSQWLMLMSAPISVPGYLLLRRGRAGVANGILALVLFAGVYYLAGWTIWGLYYLLDVRAQNLQPQ